MMNKKLKELQEEHDRLKNQLKKINEDMGAKKVCVASPAHSDSAIEKLKEDFAACCVALRRHLNSELLS